VWVLYLDLYILNAAGSLLDAALLAALAALQDTALPAGAAAGAVTGYGKLLCKSAARQIMLLTLGEGS
jgi:exosome complex RNA-binding protein Rrp42 (RNase PH superfamily)